MAHAGDPSVRVVRRRREPDLRAAPVDGIASEGHHVLPADEAADPARRGVGDSQVVAGADAVEQALVHCRHQLAVLGEEALWAEQEQGVVERARPVGLPLVDADGAMDVERRARLGDPVVSGPGTSTELSHRRSQSSFQPSKEAASWAQAPDSYSGMKTSGKTASCDVVLRGLLQEVQRLVDTRLGVKVHRRGLDRRDADGRKAHPSSIRRVGAGLVAQSPGAPGSLRRPGWGTFTLRGGGTPIFRKAFAYAPRNAAS